MVFSHCLAKALYDNSSESPDELAFCKGDILTVLEQNPNGLEGWWLCSLRGRQGIAPGNRLRLIPGMYDTTGLGYAGASSPCGSANSMKLSSPSRPSTPSVSMNGARRRSWHTNSNRVVTPQKIGDIYLYDVPSASGADAYDIPVSRQLRSINSSPLPNQVFQSSINQSKSNSSSLNTSSSPKIVKACNRGFSSMVDAPSSQSTVSEANSKINECLEEYDVPLPPRRVVPNDEQQGEGGNYDIPPPPTTKVVESELLTEISYDIPKSNRSSVMSHVSSTSSLLSPSPQSNCSSLGASVSFSSLGGSNRSSLEQPLSEVYDIPPPGNPRRAVPLCGDGSNADEKCSSHSSPVAKHTLRKGSSIVVSKCDLSNGNVNDSNDTANNASQCAQVYDLPKSMNGKCNETSQEMHTNKRISTSSNESRDSATYSSICNDCVVKELNVDLNEGITLIVKHQQQVHSAINDLFSLISGSNWRNKENLSCNITALQDACHRLKNYLKQFLEFANCVYVNSLSASDKTLSQKMSKLLLQLNDSNTIIQNAISTVDAKGWTVDRLATSTATKTPDEVDQLVACSRGLTEDMKHIISFIRGNAKLLFKETTLEGSAKKPPIMPKPNHLRPLPSIPPPGPPKNPNLQSRPLPPLPPLRKVTQIKVEEPKRESSPDSELMNDYDYVSLESKESVNQKNAAVIQKMKDTFENIVKHSEIMVDHSFANKSPTNTDTDIDIATYGRLCDATTLEPSEVLPKWLHPSDRQVLLLYCAQLDTHKCFLTNAIDAFIATINQNQPPKVFIERSKFVVVAALKMIYIGDAIARSANNDLKNKVSTRANALCDFLKTLVINTKKAASDFPSVTAVQQMVDCVVDISISANKLYKTLIKTSDI
ncbi:breast cancer anti-estrogen resistance protein 1-like protein [Dinothrombium tinctorium]|uniref:Breast cancer anti-estrogen resistance protein 1-like protein n=1 Tax=Dinothrombium tinctorium TaxID=1965070 RepID=A0A443RRG7_9ACAR|nr:breast cancer anti-estrogen resistance protein 1-like protein [Dinothrombium tinctorium]